MPELVTNVLAEHTYDPVSRSFGRTYRHEKESYSDVLKNTDSNLNHG